MRTVIYKYPIEVVDKQLIEMPIGAEILTAQMQDRRLCLWAQVDIDQECAENRNIRIYGTGNLMPNEPGVYIATVQMFAGGLVWHVYDDTYA